jgi:sec-independent protein translocase protein TatA
MEIMVIAVIALIVLGPSRLPEAARSLGKGLKEMRDSFQGNNDDDDDVAQLDADLYNEDEDDEDEGDLEPLNERDDAEEPHAAPATTTSS